MRRRTIVAAVAALLVLAASPVAAAQSPAAAVPSVAGKWNVAMELSIGTSTPTFAFKQDGDKITGTYTSSRYGEAKLTGTIDAKGQVQVTVALDAEGMSVSMFFHGEVSADGQSITKGTVNIEGLGEGTWVAKKAQ